MPYFFDTYAMIEILSKNENYETYSEEEIITSTLNLAELFYGFLKERKKERIDEWRDKVKVLITEIDTETIIKAVTFKHEHKEKSFSFIDCLGYSLARKLNIQFLTGDQEFENIEHVEFVKK